MQRYESTSTAIRPTIDILNVNALRSLLWRIMHLTKAFFGQLWRLIMLRLSAWKSAGLLNCFRCTIDSNLFSRAGHGSIFFLHTYLKMCMFLRLLRLRLYYTFQNLPISCNNITLLLNPSCKNIHFWANTFFGKDPQFWILPLLEY